MSNNTLLIDFGQQFILNFISSPSEWNEVFFELGTINRVLTNAYVNAIYNFNPDLDTEGNVIGWTKTLFSIYREAQYLPIGINKDLFINTFDDVLLEYDNTLYDEWKEIGSIFNVSDRPEYNVQERDLFIDVNINQYNKLYQYIDGSWNTLEKNYIGNLETYAYCKKFVINNIYLRNIENVYWRELLAINDDGSMIPVAGMKIGDVFIDNDASSNPLIYQYNNDYWRFVGEAILIEPNSELNFEEDAIFFDTTNNRLVQFNTALVYPREPFGWQAKGNYIYHTTGNLPLNNMNDTDIFISFETNKAYKYSSTIKLETPDNPEFWLDFGEDVYNTNEIATQTMKHNNLFIDLETNENYLWNSSPTIVEFGWEEDFNLLETYGRPEIYDTSHNDIYIDIENNKIEQYDSTTSILWRMIKDNSIHSIGEINYSTIVTDNGIIDSLAKFEAIETGEDYIWMYLADGTFVAKIEVLFVAKNGAMPFLRSPDVDYTNSLIFSGKA